MDPDWPDMDQLWSDVLMKCISLQINVNDKIQVKIQYVWIHAPYTRIVVFWHTSNIPPKISWYQISCNTTTFCIAAIFVKYCYTTSTHELIYGVRAAHR